MYQNHDTNNYILTLNNNKLQTGIYRRISKYIKQTNQIYYVGSVVNCILGNHNSNYKWTIAYTFAIKQFQPLS